MEKKGTFGERLVGYMFNPQGDKNVDTVKKAFAGIVDLIETFPENTRMSKMIKKATIIACLQAQMLAVKLITLKE